MITIQPKWAIAQLFHLIFWQFWITSNVVSLLFANSKLSIKMQQFFSQNEKKNIAWTTWHCPLCCLWYTSSSHALFVALYHLWNTKFFVDWKSDKMRRRAQKNLFVCQKAFILCGSVYLLGMSCMMKLCNTQHQHFQLLWYYPLVLMK